MENELEKVQAGMEELKDAMNQKFANLESSVESVPGHVIFHREKTTRLRFPGFSSFFAI
jgi:hypothetical protein